MNESNSQPPVKGPSLLEELRRRKVVRVGLAYLMASWVVLQVADVVVPILDAPDWTLRLLFGLLAIGFPVALLLSWLYELTPEGIRTTKSARARFGEAQHAAEIQARRNRFAWLIGGVIPAMLIGVMLGAAAVWTLLRPDAARVRETALPTGLPVLAVLPFQNMSPDPDNAFFSEGVHEEVMTSLSRLPELKVISRTSVMRFADAKPSLPEIAERLGATHVVEGSVRRAGNAVRITAQLIDATTDQHLWAENYDRALEDIFEIQASVAASIATALSIRFSVEENPALASQGTTNLRAYDLYLKANPQAGFIVDSAEKIEFLEEALALDPDYVQAWQALARVRCWPVFGGADPGAEHMARAEEALGQAKRLAPGTTDTLMAEAWVLYWCKQDFEAARRLVERAREREPTRADLIWLEALLARRMGDWDIYFRLSEESARLDPLNPGQTQDLAFWLKRFGRYEQSYRYYLQLLRNTANADRWLHLDLDIAHVFTSPDYGEWQEIMERFLDAGIPEGPDGQSNAGLIVGEYLLLQDRRDEYWEYEYRPDLASNKYALSAKYQEAVMLAFLGRRERALEEARVGLDRAAAIERREREQGTLTPQGIQIMALIKARLGAMLGETDVVVDSLAELESWQSDPDHAVRRRALYWYIEALAESDPRRAQRLYLDADTEILPPHEFATRPHLWYPLLENPEVRARFDDEPEWVQFMRDLWPVTREFPFDRG